MIIKRRLLIRRERKIGYHVPSRVLDTFFHALRTRNITSRITPLSRVYLQNVCAFSAPHFSTSILLAMLCANCAFGRDVRGRYPGTCTGQIAYSIRARILGDPRESYWPCHRRELISFVDSVPRRRDSRLTLGKIRTAINRSR